MCECVNETSDLLVSFCLEDAPKALQFKSTPLRLEAGIFFLKKMQKKFGKG